MTDTNADNTTKRFIIVFAFMEAVMFAWFLFS